MGSVVWFTCIASDILAKASHLLFSLANRVDAAEPHFGSFIEESTFVRHNHSEALFAIGHRLGNEGVAPTNSPAIDPSRHLLSFCAGATDCYKCTVLEPACAWCASSGQCLSSPVELLRLHTELGPHLFLSQEEHQKSYGNSSRHEGPGLVGSHCDVWITSNYSCGFVEEYCTDLNNCAACTTVPECGFCYHQTDARCMAGTQSGELLFRSVSADQRRCASVAHEPAAFVQHEGEVDDVSSWFFGNWSHYYSTRLWENECIESKCPRWQRFATSSGQIGMGHAELRVSYAGSSDCSWEIYPDPWPEGEELVVSLLIDHRRSRSDMLSLSYLEGVGQNILFDHVGCLGSMNITTCDVEAVVRSSEPLLLRFQSSRNSLSDLKGESTDLFSKSVFWTATWNLVPVGRPYNDAATRNKYIIIFAAIFVLAIFLLICGCVCCCGVVALYYSYVVGDALPGSAVNISHIEPIDLNVVEQEIESFRPYTVASESIASIREPSGKFCSVCLTEFEVGQEVRTLVCNHSFHKTCGDTWFSRKLQCPLCRYQVCHWPPCRDVAGSVDGLEQDAHSSEEFNGVVGAGRGVGAVADHASYNLPNADAGGAVPAHSASPHPQLRVAADEGLAYTNNSGAHGQHSSVLTLLEV